MVSVTLSLPEQVHMKMKLFDEINWSGFIRRCILQKTHQLEMKEQLLAGVQKDEEIGRWFSQISTPMRKERVSALKKKGLI
ncbi:hypothetical protein J4206_04270 [Candidatus Woesearchaeota archaeon]|nr:hypothetical protein [Candidatus Woesearchaeota archaeon]